MKLWPLSILLKPLFLLAYVALVSALLWLCTKLPDSRLKRLLLKRW